MAGFQFVKVSSSNYFCSQGKLIGSEAATLFIPRRYTPALDRVSDINKISNFGLSV
jgi:hypothetical protein